MTATLDEDDYIIGTNDAEIRRLGFQHALWAEAAHAAWRRAGITQGMTVMDVGCGPGYAAFDLARLVGPNGRVIAVDQSERFLQSLEAGAEARGLANIETRCADLADFDWPDESCDAVWCRWVLSFFPDPDGALAGIARTLKPGGGLITQEYVDYRSFRIEPAEPVFERFIEAVSASWRHFGGDPDVARRFPKAMAATGLSIETMQPLIFSARPADPIWRWPVTWLEEAPDRLVELGFLSAADAAEFRTFIQARSEDPDALLMTPMVLDLTARKAR